MGFLLLPFTPRYILLTLVVAALVLCIALAWHYPEADIPLSFPIVLLAFLAAVGIHDLVQTKHAILRNYPIAAHIRFILEHIRPELRQYFFEAEKDGMPFPRDKRALVYQRAKKALDTRPFGTHYDVYREHYEWLHHSMVPAKPTGELFRINVGGPDCAAPYSASVLNISAMSFGSISAKLRQRALVVPDKAARVANFHKETVLALGALIAAAGLDHPRELRAHHFVTRAEDCTLTFRELYGGLEPGELLAGTDSPRFREEWLLARAETFKPAGELPTLTAGLAAE